MSTPLGGGVSPRKLGLGDELEATGIPAAEIVHFDRHGNRIWGFARAYRSTTLPDVAALNSGPSLTP